MKKIVLLSGDTKSVREVNGWLKELSEETLVEALSDPEEFRKRYCTEGEPEDAAQGGAAEGDAASTISVDLDALGENSRRHFTISLLVVDLILLERSPIEWILETRDLLQKFGFSKEDEPTRIVLIGYEAADFEIDKFRHDAIDDLMLKPLDKALFLQKMELHLSDGESANASFLFKQRTELQIEMGKDSWIESISEFGFAIRNPAPLATGVFARVYSQLFGEGMDAGLIGRVYRAERHPSEPGVYLCYLTFHGVTSTQLSTIRKFIRLDKTVFQKPPIPAPGFEAPMKTVIVVDMNADSRDLVADSLQSNYANVRVQGFPSYSSFLKYCARRMPGPGGSLPPAFAEAAQPPDPTAAVASADGSETQAEVPAGPKEGANRLTLAGSSEISLIVDANSAELKSFEPGPKGGAKILGIDARELLERPTSWMGLFNEAANEEIEEFLAYLRSGQSGHILLVADGGPEIGQVRLRLRGRIERAGEADGVTTARLTLRELSDEEWNEAATLGRQGDDMSLIDAIYIDGALLGEDASASLEGMAEILKKARMIESRESLTIVIMGDERSRLRPSEYRLKSVHDFSYKPLDRKMLLAKAALLVKGLVPKTDILDLNYRRAGKSARITKEVLMEELSEFGLQIRHETALREMTFLRFFSSVFLDQKGDGLLGRCLFSTKDPETGAHHCFFSFFGVTDAQLKHIRNWIRGDYASRKEKSGS